MPRFAAVSELFELVGVIDGRHLTLYLDRFDDNAPVSGARVELQLGGARLALQEHADGEFEATLPQELKPGLTAVTATVVAGDDSRSLTADIDLRARAPAAPADARGWSRERAWVAGGLAASALLAALAWRARAARAARHAGDDA